jgi:hypothetical protein
MEAWWSDPRSKSGVAEATRNVNDECLTRLAFSWKTLQLTVTGRPSFGRGVVVLARGTRTLVAHNLEAAATEPPRDSP